MKQHIGKFTAVAMLIVAGIFDLLQFVVSLLDATIVLIIVSVIFSTIITVIAGVVFYIWLKVNGVSFFSVKDVTRIAGDQFKNGKATGFKSKSAISSGGDMIKTAVKNVIKQRGLIFGTGITIEAIPVLNDIPGWLGAILLIILSVWAEEAIDKIMGVLATLAAIAANPGMGNFAKSLEVIRGVADIGNVGGKPKNNSQPRRPRIEQTA